MQNIPNIPQAVAVIHGNNNTIGGTVRFYRRGKCVLISADINGLTQNNTGFYGFHIHEGESCGGEGFSDSQGHYNPNGTTHPLHAGDLPPLMLCGKIAHLEVLSDRFSLDDIIGKTVIIHSDADDLTSQPAGNAGVKIACGIIRKI